MIGAVVRALVLNVTRSRRALLATLAWTTVSVVLAILARSSGFSHSADRVLLGAYGPVVLPLLCYMLVGAVVGGRSLASTVAPLTMLGAPPRLASLLVVASGAAACAVAGGLAAALVALLAHGAADPPFWGDAAASAYVGALGGSAYGSWFALGASFGKRGGGRLACLAIDWVVGATDGGGALFTPRGHVRNLFGGSPPLNLSERASAGVLLLLVAVCAAIASRRGRL